MHEHHMGDAVVVSESICQHRGGDGLVFGKRLHAHAAAHHVGELGGTLAIGAVVQHQNMPVAGHHGGYGGLYAEGAAALQRHDGVVALRVDDVEQAGPHTRRDGDEIGVPRAPVAQHRQLGA